MRSLSITALVFAGVLVVVSPLDAQTAASAPGASAGQAGTKPAPAAAKPAAKKAWVMPRTPDGKPDLQGNWTNETQTPLERMGAGGATLTDAQASAVEDRALLVEQH